MNLTYKAIVNGSYLKHYNPYHDPKNGRFKESPYKTDSYHTRQAIKKMYSEYDADEKAANARVSGGNKKTTDYSKGFKATSDALGKAAKNVSNIRLHDKKQKTDLSQYSDAELQRIVNRLGNEQRYEQLTRSENVSKGQKFINGLGTGLTIATLVTGAIGGAAGAYTAFTGKSPIELFKKK